MDFEYNMNIVPPNKTITTNEASGLAFNPHFPGQPPNRLIASHNVSSSYSQPPSVATSQVSHTQLAPPLKLPINSSNVSESISFSSSNMFNNVQVKTEPINTTSTTTSSFNSLPNQSSDLSNAITTTKITTTTTTTTSTTTTTTTATATTSTTTTTTTPSTAVINSTINTDKINIQLESSLPVNDNQG